MKYVALVAVTLLAILVIFWHPATVVPVATLTPAAPVTVTADTAIPLPRWSERVTKKPFGIFITPADSPVQPERFTGYHTGTDFELLPGEDETTLAVRAICDGTVLVARRASGYGGVLVQSCTIGQPVTVLYGHLNPDAFRVRAGQIIRRGDALDVLGKGYSPQTDGERPHLHLSIHIGTAAVLAGYSQTRAGLAAWQDPLPILPDVR